MKLTFTLTFYFFFALAHGQYSENVQVDEFSAISDLRSQVSDYVFGDEVIPVFQKDPGNYKYMDVFAGTYKSSSLRNFETGTVTLKHGFNSKICIFHPEKSNGLNIPIIYHTGHNYSVLQEDLFVNYKVSDEVHIKVIDFFLSKGFDVIGINMPFYGANKHPDIVTENTLTLPMYGHNELFNLDHPFYYFMAPVKSVVDYLQQQKGYNEFVMIGLSGGGWSTTLYSAIDTRIKLSFPVAGSIPLPLRTDPRDAGDLEQNYPDFYNRFNYSTLYYLGASGSGRRQYQILNKFDDCCFAFDGKNYWVGSIKSHLESKDAGTFEFYYDTFSLSQDIGNHS